MTQVIDTARIGKKGYPRHYQAYGVEPPMMNAPEDLPVDPAPDPTSTVETFRRAIQNLLDRTAQTRRYDSGTTISTYVNSTNPVWAAEAEAFVAWRDAVWAYAYAELEKVESELRPIPSVEDFLAELPAISWPELEEKSDG